MDFLFALATIFAQADIAGRLLLAFLLGFVPFMALGVGLAHWVADRPARQLLRAQAARRR